MSTVVNLGGLGPRGFVVGGGAAGDFAGWSVSSAGDVNGDGFDDIIVGALYSDLSGSNSGSAYVIYGKPGGFSDFSLTLANLTPSTGFIISSDASSFTGLSVSAAGDVNGDGFDDVIVGTFKTAADKAYVIFGKASHASPVDLTNLSSSDGFGMTGPANPPPNFFYGPYPGSTLTVSDAGDVNGDGFSDVIMGFRYANGAKGGAYVVFGKAGGFSTVDLTTLSASQGFAIVGAMAGDHLGASVSGAGDINNDGFDDVIVGAYSGDAGGSDAGQAYVIFGKANGFATVDLASLPASAGFMIQGDAAGDRAGESVSDAGDINHDGFDDFIIGAPGNGAGGSGAGAAYVIFGKGTGFGTIDLTNLGTAGFIIQGDAAGDGLGASVSSAGDFNHDGFADSLVGARGNDAGGMDSGRVYVIFGKASGFATVDTTNLDSTAGVILQGPTTSGVLGWSVSGAGDINHDGFADVVVGAPFVGNTNEGRAYIVLGSGIASAALAHAGDFNGDGRDDILWRNDSGRVTDWLGQSNGSFATNFANADANAGLDWHLGGIGDFNGDTRDDLLWRNNNGDIFNWLAQANGGFASNAANSYVHVDGSWQIVGTGDFNGDNRDDILWRSNIGRVTNWLGQATGGFLTNFSNSDANAGLDWHIVAVGDFNGDNRDDLLWRNDNGDLFNWLAQANGGFVSNSANSYMRVDTSWQVVGTGDFNGDGRDDILWRDSNGRVTDWLGQPSGGFATNFANADSDAGLRWTIASTGDFNGDNRDDILWRNDNGDLVNWLGQANGGFANNSANAYYGVDPTWHVQPQEQLV